MTVSVPSEPAEASRAGSLPLVAGALALDFANTASGRGGERYLDHLKHAADIVAFARHASLLDEATAKRLADKISAGDAAFAGFFRDALSLREAVHRIAAAVARRGPPDQTDLSLLSSCCAAALAKAAIEMSDAGARWRWPTADPAPETVLGPIALSAVGLLREGDPSRLKQCPGEHCGWVFFDMTKNRSRRWCEMSVCGNRAKAKAHYRRLKFRAEAVGEAAPQDGA
ncbi:MAG: CGNR zinc finger domain-containing protein [Hyphomicrobiales bacterium]